MRLPNALHQAHPWRIHEITGDFRLEDVWQLPTLGGPDDFPRLVDLFTSMDPAHDSPFIVRFLFAARMKLGQLFGWDATAADTASTAVATAAPSIADRLPADLRGTDAGQTPATFPFDPLFRLDDEYAAELANHTMHGIIHLGWVPEADEDETGDAADDGGGDEAGAGRYTGQLAIYVKPNGLLGEAYMAAIKPFRYLFVYPQMLEQIRRRWEAARVDALRDA
jgi:hypothetical protein